MNKIILAPCDFISKIKQNSSDMNEIILASCDAGYVQNCTGFFLLQLTILAALKLTRANARPKHHFCCGDMGKKVKYHKRGDLGK
jgi:hypothetical protein